MSVANAGTVRSDSCALTRVRVVLSQVVGMLMKSLQKEGEKGMEAVLANSAPGNPLKTMPYDKVVPPHFNLNLNPCSCRFLVIIDGGAAGVQHDARHQACGAARSLHQLQDLESVRSGC